jgi:hypothetical protein
MLEFHVPWKQFYEALDVPLEEQQEQVLASVFVKRESLVPLYIADYIICCFGSQLVSGSAEERKKAALEIIRVCTRKEESKKDLRPVPKIVTTQRCYWGGGISSTEASSIVGNDAIMRFRNPRYLPNAPLSFNIGNTYDYLYHDESLSQKYFWFKSNGVTECYDTFGDFFDKEIANKQPAVVGSESVYLKESQD